MITAADEIFIDFSTSCTRDVAVAKLLGWMQGPVRRKHFPVTEKFNLADQLPHLHSLDGPIMDLLLEMRGIAQQKLYKAYEDDDASSTAASQKVLSDAADEVESHSKNIYLAAKYFRDIDEELSKREEPKLHIDVIATKALDNPYITLNSLADWAKTQYGIVLPDGLSSDAKEGDGSLSGDIEQLRVDIGKSKDAKGKFPEGGKAEVSLLVTFAFLVDAFIEQVRTFGDDTQRDKFLKGPNKANINVSAIAGHLEELMAKANGKKLLDDQQIKSISIRITAAFKAQSEALPKKGN